MSGDENKKDGYRVPELAGQILGALPVWPGSALFAAALNEILTPRLPDDVRDMMAGKNFRLKVTDAKLEFNFAWTKGGFVAGLAGTEPDLTISAAAYDFYLLSKREADPDTLFFSRRLVMEGDTELGLMLKNTLDAMELNVFEQVKKMPSEVLRSMASGSRKDSRQTD